MSLRFCALLLLASGCVDETGYLDPSIEDLDPTGFAYSAGGDLSAEREVVFVGLPGFLPADSGEVTLLDAAGEETYATPSEGTFTISAMAQAGAEFVLTFVPEGADKTTVYQLDFTVDDDLSELSAPSPSDSFGGVASPPDADGNTHIQISSLEDPADRYIAFNTSNGAVDIFEDTDEGILPAESGDTVCLCEADADAASPYWCTPIP